MIGEFMPNRPTNQFAIANSTGKSWFDAVDDCCSQISSNMASESLGFIYSSGYSKEQVGLICKRLADQITTGGWIGATGVGILRNSQEHYDEAALNVMIGDFPENSFRIFSEVVTDLKEFYQTHCAWFQSNLQNFAVVHADPATSGLLELLPSLSDMLGGGYLVGALSSSHEKPTQIVNGRTSDNVSGALFSESVMIHTGLTQGCSPIGPHREITKVDKNIIVSIDGRPAFEVLMEDIGREFVEDVSLVSDRIFAALPVVGSDTRDYVVRNIVGIDTDSNLIAIGDRVGIGDPIMFCQRNQFTAKDDLIRMLRDLKKRCGHSIPRGGIYFSCLGRGRHTFDDDSMEMKLIKQEFGDFPLVGFFANGEISHRRLYTYTGVMTLFM